MAVRHRSSLVSPGEPLAPGTSTHAMSHSSNTLNGAVPAVFLLFVLAVAWTTGAIGPATAAVMALSA